MKKSCKVCTNKKCIEEAIDRVEKLIFPKEEER